MKREIFRRMPGYVAWVIALSRGNVRSVKCDASGCNTDWIVTYK